jgi:parallel beta-helix repeat protein
MSNNFIRDVTPASVLARKPVSEDLMQRFRDNPELLEALVFSLISNLLAGAVDSVLVGVITDADPTSGLIAHDNQFDGIYLRMTSGTVFTNNNSNKFKIVATSKTANTISVTEDLQALGVVAADTYIILGHTHDGDATTPDGARIEMKSLANSAEDQVMTQALADAVLDPDINRDVATKANPLATVSDVETAADDARFVWADDSTTFGLNGTADISSIVPVGTSMVEVYIQAESTSATPFTVTGKLSAAGANREIMKSNSDGTNVQNNSTTAMLPVNGSREIFTGVTGPIGTGNLSVRTYQQ